MNKAKLRKTKARKSARKAPVLDFQAPLLSLCAHGNARFGFRFRANAPEAKSDFLLVQ